MDFYPYDGLSYDRSGLMGSSPGRRPVGDCRIRARVKLDAERAGGEVFLGIEDAGHDFALIVRPGPPSQVVLCDNNAPVWESSVESLQRDQVHSLELANYDDRLVGKLDGAVLFSRDYEGHPSRRRSLRIGAQDADAVWDRVIVERDLHYTTDDSLMREGEAVQMAAGEYFVLGDNSPASSDSRRWEEPGVPESNLIGKAFFAFWPVHYMKWLGASGR
jgi:hypothetical protein